MISNNCFSENYYFLDDLFSDYSKILCKIVLNQKLELILISFLI